MRPIRNMKYIDNSQAIVFSCIYFSIILFSCKKSIQVDPPINSITTSEAFADSSDANSAILGIYTQLINTNGNAGFGNGLITLRTGSSSDELVPFNTGGDQFYANSLISSNGFISTYWRQAYSSIYQANGCIEGLQASAQLSQSVKNQFISEAKFLRAFCYYYLINLFGDVPYITSTAWQQTESAGRTSKDKIYQAIITDLKECQNSLRSDFSMSLGERTRATKMAASALLARIYLNNSDWKDAEAEATAVINDNNFNLLTDLNSVFLANSNEAILQWQLNPTRNPYNATTEGISIIPNRASQPPGYYLNPHLLSSFESGDQRDSLWVKLSIYNGKKYYYPYKYKIGNAQKIPNATPTEYYMVLRLGEQYLIRAEARAQLEEANAIYDLNAIRERAKLLDYSGMTDRASLLNAIYQERRVELFGEWGHRWFDLKRTGQIDSVMAVITPSKANIPWDTHQKLYPIPMYEIQTDPNLIQNDGYK